MSQNFTLQMLKFVVIDVIGDFFYFPFWWYTQGSKRILFFIWQKELDIFYSLGLNVWLKVMFKPMYADYSFGGRVISFFMRIVILIVDLLFVLLWNIGLVIILLVWLFLPPIALAGVLFNLPAI